MDVAEAHMIHVIQLQETLVAGLPFITILMEALSTISS